jgi:hypothetical protein
LIAEKGGFGAAENTRKEKKMGRSGKDYIPSNATLFDVWFKFLVQYVEQKTSGSKPDWSHIPPEVVAMILAAYAAWYTVYSAAVGPHTEVDTEARNNAKKAAVKVIRPFVNQYLRFPPVTDEDRTAMGIPNHDGTRSHIGKPATTPVFNTRIRGIGKVTVVFHDEDTESRRIPYGMNGAVISIKISDTPITDPKMLDRTELATKSPHDLHFEAKDRGKTVYIAMQWQNESGIRGNFSEIQSAIIP